MVSKPKLGIVGYYHYGNYGDELFLDVFRQHLGDFEFVFFQDMLRRPYFRTPLAEKVRSVDAILIGGGDLVIPNYWSDQYFEPQYLEKPVYIHGVGVPTWGGKTPRSSSVWPASSSTRACGTFMFETSRAGTGSSAKLAPTIDTQVTPDIVCALDLPEVTRADGAPIFGLISRKQNPGSIHWKNIHALCARAKSYGYRLRHIVLATGVIGKEDREAVAESALHEAEVFVTESITDLTRAIGECAVVASMKFHGCVVATMYGTPAITLITTDKFRNFYKLIERDELVAHHRHETLPDRLPRYVAKIPDLTRKDIGNRARQGLGALAQLIRKDLGISSTPGTWRVAVPPPARAYRTWREADINTGGDGGEPGNEKGVEQLYAVAARAQRHCRLRLHPAGELGNIRPCVVYCDDVLGLRTGRHRGSRRGAGLPVSRSQHSYPSPTRQQRRPRLRARGVAALSRPGLAARPQPSLPVRTVDAASRTSAGRMQSQDPALGAVFGRQWKDHRLKTASNYVLFDMVGDVLSLADGVIVHSQFGLNKLRATYGAKATSRITVIPHFAPPLKVTSPADARKRSTFPLIS